MPVDIIAVLFLLLTGAAYSRISAHDACSPRDIDDSPLVRQKYSGVPKRSHSLAKRLSLIAYTSRSACSRDDAVMRAKVLYCDS